MKLMFHKNVKPYPELRGTKKISKNSYKTDQLCIFIHTHTNTNFANELITFWLSIYLKEIHN